METRKGRLTLMLSAVAALVCAAGFFTVPRLLDRQEEEMFRYKTARHTTASALRKEHRVNAQPGHEWVVFYESRFPIYRFHKSKTGDWEQADIDSNATRTLDTAEQRHNQQSGDRETFVSQDEYDSLSVGDRLDVAYRLRADNESVEIIGVHRVTH
jgi:hypothetical protein